MSQPVLTDPQAAMESKAKSLGEKLRKERERKKVTLDDVATATKISSRMLRAIEEERFDQLPGGIFNKSFVRTYARYLGMNEERALADYVKNWGEPVEEESEGRELRAIAERKEKEKEQQLAGRRKTLRWQLVAVLLFLVSIGLAAWSLYSSKKPINRRSQSSAASLPATIAPRPAIAPSSTPDATRNSPAPLDGIHDGTPLDTTVSPSATAFTPVSDRESGLAREVETSSATTAPFQVLIEAREDSWLSVTADGKLIFHDTLAFPQQKTFQAQRQMTVRAGNVGGLDFSFNGTRLKLQGTEEQAKTLVFGSDGLQSTSAKPAN